MRRLASLIVPAARTVARFFYRVERKLVGLSKERLSDHQQWAAWQADIERISNETTYAFRNRLVFRAILEMYQNNTKLQRDGARSFTVG